MRHGPVGYSRQKVPSHHIRGTDYLIHFVKLNIDDDEGANGHRPPRLSLAHDSGGSSVSKMTSSNSYRSKKKKRKLSGRKRNKSEKKKKKKFSGGSSSKTTSYMPIVVLSPPEQTPQLKNGGGRRNNVARGRNRYRVTSQPRHPSRPRNASRPRHSSRPPTERHDYDPYSAYRSRSRHRGRQHRDHSRDRGGGYSYTSYQKVPLGSYSERDYYASDDSYSYRRPRPIVRRRPRYRRRRWRLQQPLAASQPTIITIPAPAVAAAAPAIMPPQIIERSSAANLIPYPIMIPSSNNNGYAQISAADSSGVYSNSLAQALSGLSDNSYGGSNNFHDHDHGGESGGGGLFGSIFGGGGGGGSSDDTIVILIAMGVAGLFIMRQMERVQNEMGPRGARGRKIFTSWREFLFGKWGARSSLTKTVRQGTTLFYQKKTLRSQSSNKSHTKPRILFVTDMI
jgi:hypothetical protein